MRRRLPVVAARDALRGKAPVAYERLVRAAAPLGRHHRGAVRGAAQVVDAAVRRALPPRRQVPALAALAAVDGWCRHEPRPGTLRSLRDEIHDASPALERATVDAIAEAPNVLRKPDGSPLADHANAVVLRYAGLAAAHTISAVCLLLDGCDRPEVLVDVPALAAGALAYQEVGLGAARAHDLRERAVEHAEWELKRPGRPPHHGLPELTLQLFHEYLGAHWKDRSDGHRAHFDEFLRWVASGARADGPALLPPTAI